MIECNGSLPAAGRIFLIGIGGIGMSGLAQLLVYRGYQVAGSDRGLAEPDRAELYAKLRSQGIVLYDQDGSGPRDFRPDALIVSSAIEEGNPDLVAAAGVPVVHRAAALSAALDDLPGKLVTVAGSCGKTSVTGWLAWSLREMGYRVLMVDGGYCCQAESETMPGNFLAETDTQFKVVEVDESDRSLSAFHPDFGLLLNIGHDHYSEEVLRLVFGRYLAQCRIAWVAPEELADLCPSGVPGAFFSCGQPQKTSTACVEKYHETRNGAICQIRNFGEMCSPQCGLHSGWNAAAILQMLKLLCPEKNNDELCQSLASFRGVHQRFEVMGETADGRPVIDDYAHNPEKIAAAIATARARFGSPLLMAFQPHGYGPFGQMREELGKVLATVLGPDDDFILLPVYYAGGTSSFKPKAEDVAAEYAANGLPVRFLPCLAELADCLKGTKKYSCALVMGARDPSLRRQARELTDN